MPLYLEVLEPFGTGRDPAHTVIKLTHVVPFPGSQPLGGLGIHIWALGPLSCLQSGTAKPSSGGERAELCVRQVPSTREGSAHGSSFLRVSKVPVLAGAEAGGVGVGGVFPQQEESQGKGETLGTSPAI